MIGDAGGRTVLAEQMEDQWERCPGNQRVKGPGSSGRECLKTFKTGSATLCAIERPLKLRTEMCLREQRQAQVGV